METKKQEQKFQDEALLAGSDRNGLLSYSVPIQATRAAKTAPQSGRATYSKALVWTLVLLAVMALLVMLGSQSQERTPANAGVAREVLEDGMDKAVRVKAHTATALRDKLITGVETPNKQLIMISKPVEDMNKAEDAGPKTIYLRTGEDGATVDVAKDTLSTAADEESHEILWLPWKNWVARVVNSPDSYTRPEDDTDDAKQIPIFAAKALVMTPVFSGCTFFAVFQGISMHIDCSMSDDNKWLAIKDAAGWKKDGKKSVIIMSSYTGVNEERTVYEGLLDLSTKLDNGAPTAKYDTSVPVTLLGVVQNDGKAISYYAKTGDINWQPLRYQDRTMK